MKTTTRFSFIALGAALTVISLLPGDVHAQAAAADTATPLPSLKIPTKLDEIAELSKSGVGDPVILTYIKNSDTAYNLNARDIIKLRDQGVSTEVTAALIQRGAEVRQANQEAIKESQATTVAAAPTYQTQPVVETPAPVTYVVQPASTVSVHYFGGPSYRYAPTYYPRYTSYAGYSYPRYVSFGSSYYGPRVSVGVGFGGRHHGGYYGGSRSSARYCR